MEDPGFEIDPGGCGETTEILFIFIPSFSFERKAALNRQQRQLSSLSASGGRVRVRDRERTSWCCRSFYSVNIPKETLLFSR